MSMYLRLWHGRQNPNEDLDDWGTDGPILGPFDSIGGTYCSDLKAFSGDDHEVWFTFHQDLLYYDGMFYGDWSVCQDAGVRVEKADQGKADLPKDLKDWLFTCCDECAREYRDILFKCPHCGADMGGADDEEDSE